MTTTAPKTSKTLGELAVAALGNYLTQAVGYEQVVLKDRDPENLHQMRVNLRRLRTAMQVFAVGLDLPKGGAEPQVAAIARSLSSLRDLDVIIATLQQRFSPDLPDLERTTLAIILKYLGKQRKKALKQTQRALRGDRYQTLKVQLAKWVATPKVLPIAAQSMDAVLPDLTLPLISQLWLHPGWLIGTQIRQGLPQVDLHLSAAATDDLVFQHHKCLHSLRKQVKRVRYQLKFLAEFYGDRLNRDLKNLEALQTVLGDLQDSRVLEGYLSKAQPNWEQSLPTLKALLVSQRHRAWKQWQELQAIYLDPSQRETLRQTLMHPGGANKASIPATTKTTTAKTTSHKSASSTKSTPAKDMTPDAGSGRKATSRKSVVAEALPSQPPTPESSELDKAAEDPGKE